MQARMPASEHKSFSVLREITLNGSHYALLESGGKKWRLGAINPEWRDLAAAMICDKTGEAPAGVWLGEAGLAPRILTVMCCGLGAVWPGMGRELYESFPVARQAMDEVASLANWDLLALMDDASIERISQSRWQIPYLFMLEYAQWRQLHSLGIRPRIVCGHSLGELIALCVAGILDVKSAWHMLESRSEHISDLEARSGKRGGMLAVPAPEACVREALEQWPDLLISNRNTPAQFVISGPREQLMQARKALRRKKIPAVMLGMDLAFHNPEMRILREISVLRLSGLTVNRPHALMLSCVNGRPYPETARAVAETIADLDESAVDWVNLIERIEKDHPRADYLELGPQAILSDITRELAPECEFIAADRKGLEHKTMTEACARLYALGHIRMEEIFAAAESQARAAKKTAGIAPAWRPSASQVAQTDDLRDIPGDAQSGIIELIAEIANKEAAKIEPSMDLRWHLGLRSANFPLILFEAEKRFGRQIPLENLFQITTVADLIRFLAGASASPQDRRAGMRADFALARSPLRRYRMVSRESEPEAAPFNPGALSLQPETRILWLVADEALAPPEPAELTSVQEDAIDAIIIANAPVSLQAGAPAEQLGTQLANFANGAAKERSPRVIAVQRFIAAGDAPDPRALYSWLDSAARAFEALGLPGTAVAWISPAIVGTGGWSGFFLACELCETAGARVIWNGMPGQKFFANVCGASGFYKALIPVQSRQPGCFQAQLQFSLYAEPELAGHGANAGYSPLPRDSSFAGSAWLPVSMMTAALAKGIAPLSRSSLLAGLHDLRIFNYAALPAGITRECELTSCSRLRLPIDGIETRHCHVSLDIAGLAPTGRKNGSLLPLCDCSFRLPLKRVSILPDKSCAAVNRGNLRGIDPDRFYGLLEFSRVWRRIDAIDIAVDDNGGMTGCLAQINFGRDIPPEPRFQALDAFWQAAFFCLAWSAGESVPWRFSRLGLVEFATAITADRRYELNLALVWQDSQLRRFNGLLYDSDCGACAMTIYSLEFDFIH